MTKKEKFLKFKKGEVILSPFSNNKDVFIIEKGYIFAFTFSENGKRHIHLIYGPGCYFPVISVFQKSEQRASYETLTEIILTKFSRDEFLNNVEQNDKFCREILYKTINQLSMFVDSVNELHISNLETKLEVCIKQLKKNFCEQDSEELPFSLKHHHLADMLGVERESISRAMGRLKRKSLSL